MNKLILLVALVLACHFDFSSGHGMVMNPVSRGSRWRLDSSAPHNWNDNELWCGGLGNQHQTHGGRCGLCGDNFGNPTPRAHELGGTFGQGVITGTYRQGSTVNVVVRITANHRGYFTFRLCNLSSERESDACFNRNVLQIGSGGTTWTLPNGNTQDFTVAVRMPNFTCNHCVLQWTWVAANNWGLCPDGSGALGCGPQEHFRTCSDIRLTA